MYFVINNLYCYVQHIEISWLSKYTSCSLQILEAMKKFHLNESLYFGQNKCYTSQGGGGGGEIRLRLM